MNQTLYFYDRPGRAPVSRWYPTGRAPASYRGARLRQVIERHDGESAAGWVSDRFVAGIHKGPGEDTIIRNKFDIAEAEARKPGLKFNPEYFHDRRRR